MVFTTAEKTLSKATTVGNIVVNLYMLTGIVVGIILESSLKSLWSMFDFI